MGWGSFGVIVCLPVRLLFRDSPILCVPVLGIPCPLAGQGSRKSGSERPGCLTPRLSLPLTVFEGSQAVAGPKEFPKVQILWDLRDAASSESTRGSWLFGKF